MPPRQSFSRRPVTAARSYLTLIVLLACGFAPSAAGAQDAPRAERPEGAATADAREEVESVEERARAAFQRGTQLAGQGDWERAQRAFSTSASLLPRATTLFNLAATFDRLDRSALCLRALDRLDALGGTTPESQGEVRNLRAKHRARVLTLTLRLTPTDALLTLDGGVNGRGVNGAVDAEPQETGRHIVYLEPGEHLLGIEAEGHRSRSFTVVGFAGERQSREIRLEEAAPPMAPRQPEDASAQVGGVILRPVDRATVRIVSLRGLEADSSGQLSPRANHGSGVAIDRRGLILTARHVVEGADLLMVLLPGEVEPRPARQVYLDPERDLALISVLGELEHILAITTPPDLAAGERLSSSGYPVDAAERFPAASAATVGRPLNDGRVQLSMAHNPGNAGGPVISPEGVLVGIISQSGGSREGVQGVVVMEPLSRALNALSTTALERFPALDTPYRGEVEADGVLARLLGLSPPSLLSARLTALRALLNEEIEEVTFLALFSLESRGLARELMEDQGARRVGDLPTASRAQHDQAIEMARTFAGLVLAHPTAEQARYHNIERLTRDTGIARGWRCDGNGNCTPVQRWRLEQRPANRPDGWGFELGLLPGVLLETEGVDLYGGLQGTLQLLYVIGGFTSLPGARFSFVLGAEVGGGAWRSAPMFNALGQVGVRLALGVPDFAVLLQGFYAPGFTAAEGRDYFTPLGYRLQVGLLFGPWGVGVSWREVGRQSDATLRSVDLYFTRGF